MKFILRISLVVQLFLTISGILQLNAQTYVVTPSGAGSKTGTSWSNALDSVAFRSALRHSKSGDTFWVSNGIYKPANNRDSSFVIPSGVQVYGGFGGFELALNQRVYNYYTTILSGDIGTQGSNTDNCYHVVSLIGADSSTVLDGFTISDGNANMPYSTKMLGGGIYNMANGSKSSPVIANCTFTNNTAYDGGAIMNYALNNSSSKSQVINCTFYNNVAYNGGGAIFNLGDSGVSSPTISRCTFMNNNILRDSFVYTGGGAVYNISKNNGYSNPIFTNCLFSDNMADSSGGAICNLAIKGNTHPDFTNCTFVGNVSKYGGAVYSSALLSTSSLLITNSILWNDSANGSGNEIYTVSTTVVTSYSDIKGGWSGSHNKNTDPMFFNASKGDYRILPCSPLIDSGTSVGAPSVDIDSSMRPANGGYDIGAYEYQGASGNSLIPSVTINANPGTAVCIGIPSITFTAYPVFGGNNPSFQWKKNGVNVGKNDSVYIDSSVALTDKITCVLTSNSSCLFITTATSLPDSITQAALPVVNTGKISGTGVCLGVGRHIGGPLTLGYSYKWTPSSGLSSDTVSSPFVNPSTNVTYKLQVTDHTTGCTNTDSISLVVNPIPTANAGGNKTVCSGVPTSIGTTTTSSYSYSWFPSTGLSSTTISNPTVTVTTKSHYTLLVVDKVTTCRNEDTLTIDINPLPYVNAGINDTICAGSKASLNATQVKGVSYSWAPSSGLNSTSIYNPSATLFTTTQYTLTVKDSTTGCSAHDSVLVLVNPFFTMGTISRTYNMCWATYYPGIKYTWKISNYDSIVYGQGSDTINIIWKKTAGSVGITVKVWADVPCSDTSKILFSTATNDLTSTMPVVDLYPNPAKDVITIKMDKGQGHTYDADLLDITGRYIRNIFKGSNSGYYLFNTSQLPEGVYLVKISSDNGAYLIKKVDIIK